MLQDISKWNVSKVTTLSKTFDGASVFNSDLSTWDVSKIITLADTFNNAKAFNSDLSKWDVSKVTNLMRTFASAQVFHSNISNWNTSKVTHLGHTFAQAAAFNSGKLYFMMFGIYRRHNWFVFFSFNCYKICPIGTYPKSLLCIKHFIWRLPSIQAFPDGIPPKWPI